MSPQYQAELHQPESWGYLEFSGRSVFDERAGPQAPTPPPPAPDPTWPARALLMEIHNAQHAHFRRTGGFARGLQELGAGGGASQGWIRSGSAARLQDPTMEATQVILKALGGRVAP
jgi:hypothetical protein